MSATTSDIEKQTTSRKLPFAVRYRNQMKQGNHRLHFAHAVHFGHPLPTDRWCGLSSTCRRSTEPRRRQHTKIW